MIHIGIDPGKSGGLALLNEEGLVLDVEKMPPNDGELLEILREWRDWNSGIAHATLEKVGPTPQMGVCSAFTFGGGYHGLRMALLALGIPFDEVSPAKWQGAFSLPRGSSKVGRSPSAKKNAHKARASELFPSVKMTHALADALLIAEYGRRAR